MVVNLNFKTDRPLDLIAVGRLAVDLNTEQINCPMEETRSFTKYVGGSPANIAIGAAQLGLKCGFIGKVSDDQMGRFIVRFLEEKKMDTSGVVVDKTGAVTGLAFTEIKSPNDCSILMYRDNVADLKLETSEVSEDYIKKTRALLISGTALAASPSREAVFLALEYARKHDAVVFFDLDYRPYTWTSDKETAIYYNLAAEKCDVIIGTREEFDMMEQFEKEKKTDRETAGKWFGHHAEIVVIKHGSKGSITYTKDGHSYTGGIFRTKVLKTFGAGDSYASAFIYGLMNGWEISRAMEYGSASAAIVISRHSCSEAMPTKAELDKFVKTAERIDT
ncbi:5-dehydro-2-deoxygluconokinase [Thermoactinomyces mirandus]|uniref:5-dehydro-2-deoxygluconokinase n=1 Tax=Thermoactinomyces mirandus TaxID=2756294 RepID=UPI001C68C6E6